MIPRYDKPIISQIWTEQYRFETYLKVELAIIEAQENAQIPAGTAKKIKEKVSINPKRIKEIEKQTHHDVIAFCTSLTEQLPPQLGRYFHFGVTSSDIIDSALNLQIKESLQHIFPLFKNLLHTLYRRAWEMKDVICLGRSHGMFAEPMSFGQKLLGYYNEFSRRYQDLKDFYENELRVQFSGAVGSYSVLTPQEEECAAQILGLPVEPLSTQVIPRDRLAKMIQIHALCAQAIERLAVELRHLHRSEVGEIHEGFQKGQKGSSTMPHKKNPISTENLTGMARVLRSHASIAQDNTILWHERDISHSSSERLYLPDNLGLFYYSLDRLQQTIENLVFHRDRIEEKVKEHDHYLSNVYLHYLIEKTDTSREELYEEIQSIAFQSQNKDFCKSMNKKLQEKGLAPPPFSCDFQALKDLFLKHTDKIFQRSLKAYPLPSLEEIL